MPFLLSHLLRLFFRNGPELQNFDDDFEHNKVQECLDPGFCFKDIVETEDFDLDLTIQAETSGDV